MTEKVTAAVMEKPGRLRVTKFPRPRITDETCLLEVSLCGICGTDKHIYKDEVKSHPFGMPTKFPIIPGHEVVGTVGEIGEKASRRMLLNGGGLRKGDRVVPIVDLRCGECWGCRTYPGWASCERGETYGWGISSKDPPHLFGGWSEGMYLLPQTKVVKVPDAVSDEVAAYAEVLSVGYTSVARMLHSAQVFGDGSTYTGDVVVQGSGPLALAHVIAAKLAGAHRIVVVGMPEYRTRFMKQFGVDRVINVQKTTRKDERIATVTDYLDGRGAGVVFECTGDPDVVEEGLGYLKPFGYYLVAGIYTDIGRTTNVNVQKLISGKYVTIVGNGGQTEQSYAAALRMMEAHSKNIPFDRIVTHKFALTEAEDAMQTALSERSMKVVFAP